MARTTQKPATTRSGPRLLVLVDQSPASKRAVDYTARLAGATRGLPGVRLCLTYLLPPVPPELLEFAGAEDPRKEEQLDARFEAKRRRHLSSARKSADQALAAATATLRAAGITAAALECEIAEAEQGRRVVDRVLALARARRCGTVVVGRRSASWLRELLRADLAEELVRRGENHTIWVVE